ncbi:cytochrome c peroxidase [Flavobacterium sp. MC2016-06]|jgi:cytochrome c peroxidase|uniref:cytochrome-c peroxidase n=1 Tax=Flavobacterium sp. MC2016-06 TaxID=2676308 RepID=UPI0012BAFD83|nr:cytochrome c peroxidase [Flavobacterium sp. MC2016-06]MBU3860066.1 cytochrome-c peroxidase [Flavobacterium sp. MC2016-06]
MKTKLIAIGAMVFSLLILSYAKIEPNFSISELKQLYSSGDYTKWPKPEVDSIVYAQGFEDIGTLGKPEFPEDNPYTEEKAALGKVLFFDPRLSKSGQISCANCHDPELNWGDARRVSYGEGRLQGIRNSPSLLNIAYSKIFFWDGRAATLENQASFPIKDTKEMNFHIDLATKRLNKIKGYKPYFKKAFDKEKLTQEEILKAIATFERTLVSPKSKFDKFVAGDSTQLSDKQVEGLHLFRTKARCINCHNTANFSDNKFHNIGLTYYGREYEDLGRYNVTGKAANVGEFKTQSLRGVSQNAPYMHNGLFPNIRGVLNMYNAGMPQPKRKENQQNDTLFPTTSKLIQKLKLNQSELDALEAFISSLSTGAYKMRPPDLPQ